MRKKFREPKLSKPNMERLILINRILREYQDDGYVLTLRQLYYQLVTKNVIINHDKEYGKLSILMKEGRMGGIVDWKAIEDRLREPDVPANWDSPKEVLEAALYSYRRNRMQGQETYIEVWVEKDALSGVLKRVTEKYGIPIIVNRGYSSVTAMYDAYNRFTTALNVIYGLNEEEGFEDLEEDENKEEEAYIPDGKVVILYLGDHDPSGLDMIRDVKDRIMEFAGRDFEDGEFPLTVEPIALTKEQIRQYSPPPNPAKLTDTRANDYIAEHGYSSWEVDALPPSVLNRLLEDAILDHLDYSKYTDLLSVEATEKESVRQLIKDI